MTMMSATTTTAMEVNTEAKRILAVSISKLYSSRSQRGGLRLHRSLLLSLVMRSARDIYHSSRAESEAQEEPMDTSSCPEEPTEPEPQRTSRDTETEEPGSEEEEEVDSEITEDKENLSPERRCRKRRGKAAAAPDFLPSKRARLEPGEERHAAQRARLEPGEERHAAPRSSCRAGAADSLSTLSLNQVVPAF